MLKNWPSDIDLELIPILRNLNNSIIRTTHSCSGHNGKGQAYLSFQSTLSADGVIERIITPLEASFPNLFFSVRTCLGEPRFTIWLENSKWSIQLIALTQIVENILRIK